MYDIQDTFRREGLVRPAEGRLLGGVCAGLGRRFGLEPWPARILITAVMLALPGSQLLLYPVMWVLMPAETSAGMPPIKPEPTL